ncbi:hypothetical protein LZC95_08545 [Pendulispora brunnea]|uniref:DoxX family membrane protein n=1 Tax=Pendulispora brunnea TaxID=2905690 RepID=A0ABZ2KE70_9BACT
MHSHTRTLQRNATRPALPSLTLTHHASLRLLRWSLGLVFVWFGALKITGATPVAALVGRTVPFLDRTWFVPALGIFEVVLAIALVAAWQLRWVVTAMVAHLCGTFLVFVTQPNVAFQHGNPLLLTTEGEFVFKNIVLITAGLVVATQLPRRG